MTTLHRFALLSVTGLAAGLCLSFVTAAEPRTRDRTVTTEEVPRVALEVARDRAELMQDIYVAALDAMHHRYFHVDRAVIPARAMEDVFKTMERRNHSQARWISASFKAMSVDHEPQTAFEKDASRKIARGTEFVEIIEDGYYRRAGSLPFTAGCISCHSGLFASTSPARKFAGLVISIPVATDARLPEPAQDESANSDEK